MSMRIENSHRSPVINQDGPLNLVQAHRGIGEARSSIAALAVDPANSSYCNSFVNALLYVPRAIGKFFYHRYTDFRMFIKAFFSMGGGTTSDDIQNRQRELNGFQNVVRDAQGIDVVQRRQVQNAYNRLSGPVQQLFYTVDWDYLRRFADREITVEESVDIEIEITREIGIALYFQDLLSRVNFFYRVFTGLRSGEFPDLTNDIAHAINGNHAADESAHAEAPVADEPAPRRGRPVEDDPLAGLARPRPVAPRPVPRPARPGEIVFPNTVPYERGRIPAEAQRKANEINRLQGELNIPDDQIPNAFQCPVQQVGFMSIPVFDKSHPLITVDNVANRALRHIIDAESLEGMFRSGRSVRCPGCRHDLDRSNLLIDTGLQDEILAFLRGRAAANPPPAP